MRKRDSKAEESAVRADGCRPEQRELFPGRSVAELHAELAAYVRRRWSDPTTAEDLIQETWIAAIGARERFRGASEPSTWLIAIARRRMADRHRRDTRRRQLLQEKRKDAERIHGVGNAIGPQELVEAAEERRALESALVVLTDKERAAMTAIDLGRTSLREFAARQGIEPVSVRVLLHRARRKLRSALAKRRVG